MITLPDLPYELDELEPEISLETMKFHRTKHHQGYVNNLNKLIEGTSYEQPGTELEDIIMMSKGQIYNNAAQIWNHTFYFEGLAADRDENTITNDVTEYLSQHFGSPQKFMDQFTDAGKKLFGSGWVWLVHRNDGHGQIIGTDNAETPMKSGRGQIPLLVWDCWEHNYYIDHRNDRGAALAAFWKVVNWGKVSERLKSVAP